ncbi:hypothetical protein [Thalassospira australica]|uniref:hypothetical protein n=1 Tax=Thalassospira australica TaxID=1528106 RepID=UPI00384EF571
MIPALTVIRSPFLPHIKFFQKVLDLFFCLWHKRKINGKNAPGPKPARPCRLCGFLRLGPDKRGDQDAAAKKQTGRRGNSQDMGWRMAEPLRGHSALGLRELTRSFVMTGEVRLVEEGALNLPGAAAMAAAGSGDL